MRIGVIGDVHGRATELTRMLLRLEKYGVDRIIQLGDLTDRGPASVECVRIVRTWVFTTRKGKQRCVEVVLSNHEENHLYAHYKRILPGRDFVPKTQHPDVTDGLTEADYRWLDRLPFLIQIRGEKGEKFTMVHAGFHPSMKTPGWYGKHNGSKLCRIGYLGSQGEILSPYSTSSRFWADEYDGRFGQVFFGHTSHPKVTQYKHAVAVDCSKYGKLAAVVISTDLDDQPLSCFYEEHNGSTPSKYSNDRKPDSSRSRSSSSSNRSPSEFSPKAQKEWQREIRGEQKSLFTKEDLDKRPSVDPPANLPPKGAPPKTQVPPAPESPKTDPKPGGPAGQKTDDWLRRIGVRPDDTQDW